MAEALPILGVGSVSQQLLFPTLQISLALSPSRTVVPGLELGACLKIPHPPTLTALLLSAFWLRASIAAGQLRRGAIAGFHGLDVCGGRLHEARPEPVLAPHDDHLLDGDILGLRQQERHKQRHHQHPPRKEQEDAVLRNTQSMCQRKPSKIKVWL